MRLQDSELGHSLFTRANAPHIKQKKKKKKAKLPNTHGKNLFKAPPFQGVQSKSKGNQPFRRLSGPPTLRQTQLNPTTITKKKHAKGRLLLALSPPHSPPSEAKRSEVFAPAAPRPPSPAPRPPAAAPPAPSLGPSPGAGGHGARGTGHRETEKAGDVDLEPPSAKCEPHTQDSNVWQEPGKTRTKKPTCRSTISRETSSEKRIPSVAGCLQFQLQNLRMHEDAVGFCLLTPCKTKRSRHRGGAGGEGVGEMFSFLPTACKQIALCTWVPEIGRWGLHIQEKLEGPLFWVSSWFQPQPQRRHQF